MASKTGIREDVLYRTVIPPYLLRALCGLDECPNAGTLPHHVEEAIKEYLKRRGVFVEEPPPDGG